ncbi:MAG: AsmA family protein [Burkholderiales bacterium]|nr:AsmA family protein [Burkholderiales bacterium]
MVMIHARFFRWTAGLLLAPVLLIVLLIAIFGWNWLRGPIERMTLEKTGRELAINGDLRIKFGWPLPRIRAGMVTFANPAWAREKYMVTADMVEITVDFPQLIRQNFVLSEVWLQRPVVYLEQSSEGRKNWLLDLKQQDEGTRIRVDRLTLDQGMLGYDDAGAKTSIRSELSTSHQSGAMTDTGVVFSARGQYRGLPLKANGSGGGVLAMRDESMPYPLKIDVIVGRTGVRADGTITSLLKFSAIDMRMDLRGDSLDQLYPLLGIVFPATRAYATKGRLLRSGDTWRYERFSGRIGDSDIAGTLTVDAGGKRPAMKADLVSNILVFEDLGPIIGSRPGSVARAVEATVDPVAGSSPGTVAPEPAVPATGRSARNRVLPDLPFKTDRWDSVDAEVTLKVKKIRHAAALPLEDLVTHLSLRDSVLTLDPLNFGIAGGELKAVISLDGRRDPVQANARIRARKILIARMFPTIELSQTSIGEINGDFTFAGKGNSVGRMLATANGKVGLVVANGEISRLMMEKAGLHIWEILELKVTGDKLIKLHCGVANFDVKAGVMHADALVLDTAVTTIIGTGTIDLDQEKLDLTLNQKTKNTSPLALRSPIHVRGSLAKPDVEVDKGRIAARGLGAIALGLVNPLLALIPLIDAGPGQDSDCAQLVRDARRMQSPAVQKTSPRS